MDWVFVLAICCNPWEGCIFYELSGFWDLRISGFNDIVLQIPDLTSERKKKEVKKSERERKKIK
jgi:hypothetical protein